MDVVSVDSHFKNKIMDNTLDFTLFILEMNATQNRIGMMPVWLFTRCRYNTGIKSYRCGYRHGFYASMVLISCKRVVKRQRKPHKCRIVPVWYRYRVNGVLAQKNTHYFYLFLPAKQIISFLAPFHHNFKNEGDFFFICVSWKIVQMREIWELCYNNLLKRSLVLRSPLHSQIPTRTAIL